MKWTKKRPTVPGWYWFRLLVRNYGYDDLFGIGPLFGKIVDVSPEDDFEPILVRVYEGGHLFEDINDRTFEPDYYKTYINAAKDFEIVRNNHDGIDIILHGLLLVGFGDAYCAIDNIPLRDEDMEWAGPIELPEEADNADR